MKCKCAMCRPEFYPTASLHRQEMYGLRYDEDKSLKPKYPDTNLCWVQVSYADNAGGIHDIIKELFGVNTLDKDRTFRYLVGEHGKGVYFRDEADAALFTLTPYFSPICFSKDVYELPKGWSMENTVTDLQAFSYTIGANRQITLEEMFGIWSTGNWRFLSIPEEGFKTFIAFKYKKDAEKFRAWANERNNVW